MVEIGYKLACEEHGPQDLVCNARMAEESGFTFAMISDHYHPWTNRQGESPFVWGVLGGISQVTADLQLITGVTCPTMRIHPGIIAQAAATAGTMMPGRFILGLGSGENLNEHIFNSYWPPARVRIEMLEEAVEVIRTLWKGGMQSYYGTFYTLENAQIFTLPEQLPPIYIASEGPISASMAARVGDGFINPGTNAEETLIVFRDSGGADKPAYIEVSVCWAETEEEGQTTAYEQWPIPANTGELNRLLPTPAHYEQLAKMATPEDVAKHVVCGPDAEAHIKKIEEKIRMGFDHVCIHQIGHQQREFMEFYRNEVLPHFQE
ncbi:MULTISPECIES: TIGR03557 family F420-dependent LLM class oxidoreductase [Methanoculleus]|jgi:coenzyme F420-dependent glucose-6-phosphate dehydrogenase|uniref:F420-dependent oxidoreductase, G6PDH family n=1 Tax=Methanoculleus thermophilus TaxID=2200 RepID=A0A1G8Y558_9EURY|nr:MULTISPECIES: TIGR03557 family F420-dependent LLM class oxidoreductase [Methanoculleus]NLN09407.1 TIGR03557 family F420-dependent LLM class oxidoreductase [Methanoculleus thermophilus]SDJ97936.1 F420-dependent oxidoreductase, G6PDH family [Methanoculleus thermophilus]HQD25622.1 TIGR03557 family F420-dependent LLM class oxidoreductase [Methanoculleus thermophilus]